MKIKAILLALVAIVVTACGGSETQTDLQKYNEKANEAVERLTHSKLGHKEIWEAKKLMEIT